MWLLDLNFMKLKMLCLVAAVDGKNQKDQLTLRIILKQVLQSKHWAMRADKKSNAMVCLQNLNPSELLCTNMLTELRNSGLPGQHGEERAGSRGRA